MCVEIEAKLKVDSLQQVADKLAEVGAEFLEEQLQKDCYYDSTDCELKKADRALRLRRQMVGGQEKVLLTCKSGRDKSRFKRRREIEFEVSDADSAQKLLFELGYQRKMAVEKKRRLWRLGGCEVGLDEVTMLGEYVEIEGPDEEAIADVQETLGLSELEHIAKSYASLVADKLSR